MQDGGGGDRSENFGRLERVTGVRYQHGSLQCLRWPLVLRRKVVVNKQKVRSRLVLCKLQLHKSCSLRWSHQGHVCRYR